jgi:hypothetical protein
MRLLANGMLAATAVFAVSALAYAEETVIEKHTYETQQQAVEVVPAPQVKERVVEERTVTQEPPVVQKRTDTVTTTTEHDDDDGHDDD